MEEVKKEEKPYFNFSWVIYIGVVIIGCILARVLIDQFSVSTTSIPFVYFNILMIIYGFVSCIIVYQLGKVIFSLIAGFKIVSINILLIGIRFSNGKAKLYFGGKDDYSVRVQIAPKKEKVNLNLALLGGTISTLIAVGITYGLIFGLNASSNTKYFFIVSSFFYAFNLVLYVIPARMDHLNDGFSLFLISKGTEYKETLLRNYRNLDALYSNRELEYCDYGTSSNPIALEGDIYNYYYLLNKGEVEKADALASFMATKNKFFVEEKHSVTALVSKVYSMCEKDEVDALKDYYWKIDTTTRKVFTNKNNLEAIKTALYIFAFVDESEEEFAKTLENVTKAKNKYLYEERIETELKLIDNVKEKVHSAHPEWFSEDNKD